MKILLINHSDTKGGASVVTRRLMHALFSEGADVRMLVMHKDTDSPRISDAAGAFALKKAFFSEHLDIYLHNGRRRDTLFKISTGKYGLPLSRHPWVEEADVIILNWVNQGMLSLAEIEKIARSKPVIWTMHDQWNMTGVCHYTGSCDGWLRGCRSCPLTGPGTLAAKVFERKKRLYDNANVHFVAVSNTLARLCRQSPLMAGADISVIPNPFPVERFPVEPALTRRQAHLPDTGRLVAMGAARLDDPVKNLPLAIEALNALGHDDVKTVLFGNLRQPDILKKLKIPYVWLGHVDNRNVLQSVMAHSDVVLSTSVWETLPGTIVEGISCGAVGVATDCGGQSDIIDEGVNGFLVAADNIDGGEEVSAAKVTEAVEKALAMPFDRAAREERHKTMARKFGESAVARDYLRLINRLR